MATVLTIKKRDGSNEPFDIDHVRAALAFATDGLPIDPVAVEAEAAIAWHDGISVDEIQASLIQTALQHLDPATPVWDTVACRLRLYDLYNRAQVTRGLARPGYGSYALLVHRLVAEGQYTRALTDTYSDAELDTAGGLIRADRDSLFQYAGLQLLTDRYLVRTRNHQVAELPQEVFLGIALTLAIAEDPGSRLSWVAAFYDVLSRLDVTMATPTFANARRPDGQLSSCFVDTVPDSLEGIYHSLSTFARVSKSGGGLGSYLGKIRSEGSTIQHIPGVAKGVLPWMRLYSDTAVAVDQLGQRSGAVTLWLDVWHPDVLDFIEARTPQGDERRKARDIFPGLSIPDAFMEAVREDKPWFFFDPHQLEHTLGFRLEDAYGESWRERYQAAINHPDLARKTMPAKTLWRQILQAIHRSGTPFLLFRDTVNRTNPNGHAGMIYSSNLCTEILQNQSPSLVGSPEATDEDVVVQTMIPGDLVVCNLASIHLGHMHRPEDIDRTVPVVVRMLDDVITMNHLPVPQATRTNLRYRAIGLGVHGYQQYLVARQIPWESEAHVAEADALFERIAHRALEASATLAEERGAYPLFAGSGWEDGTVFAQRGYQGPAWQTLQDRIRRHGLRNGYLLAIAPTGSTSILADATPGIDPVFDHVWREDKHDYAVTRIAPGLTPATQASYVTAHQADQAWSIRAAAARQRHLDQSQSLNLYRTPTMDAKMLSQWYFLAWETGVKTVYYFRNFQMQKTPSLESAPAAHLERNVPTTPSPLPSQASPSIVCLGCEL
jgi:ribonucleoside-diphosphate reductase alpha chain